MKKFIAITILLLSVLSTASAQHWCGTMNHSEKLNSERPEIEKEVERKFQEFNNMVQENEAKGIKNSNHFVIPFCNTSSLSRNTQRRVRKYFI